MSDEWPEVYAPALLNVVEAAQLWRTVIEDDITPELYIEMCDSGDLQAKGVKLEHGVGGSWLTDMDSLLAYLNMRITAQLHRVTALIEERRLELGG